MTQNTSYAVMAQRGEPSDSLDDFPTPPWATRALLTHVIQSEPWQTVWEPTCNRGYMTRPLQEYFKTVYASDIADYGNNHICDYLTSEIATPVDWIIFNPPFRLAAEFINHSFKLNPNIGIAVFIRSTFLEGIKRYETLYKNNPPTIIAQFSERVPLVKGRYDPKASTATAYCWITWLKGENPQPFRWIKPCRHDLERQSDL